MNTSERKIKKNLFHFIAELIIINYFLGQIIVHADTAQEKLTFISQTVEWKTQLFYFRKSNSESFINKESNFFISPIGKTNPKAELEESLKVFLNPSDFLRKGLGHPQCLYPARLRFLKKHFQLNIKSISCPALKEWKEKLVNNQISIVFATQFVSNPASVMGHTFFKFINPHKEDYLNQSIGYAADISAEDGPFTFAYKGLTGKYVSIR